MMKYDKGIPKIPARLFNRNDYIPQDWIIKHFDSAVSYDFLIDIDAHDNNFLELAKTQTIALHVLLSHSEVEHEVRFTGNGFHIIIPDEALNHDYDLKTDFDSLSEFLLLIHKQLKKKFSLVDVGMGSDARRVVKMPFSLSIYDDLSTHVCVPFQSTHQLQLFELENANPLVWINKRKNTGKFFQRYYEHCLFCKGGKIKKFLEEVSTW